MIPRVTVRIAVVAVFVFGTAGVPQRSPAAVERDVSQHGEADGANAAGTHSGEPSLNPLTFQKDLAVWTGVLFLLLLAILWKFAWGPIRDGLDKREQSIADQIAQAEAANEQARELLAVYEQKLEGAKDEVHKIIAKGRQDAEQAGRALVEQARADAEAEHQRALQEIDAATSAALKELADRSATLAVELAGRIVSVKLTAADHAKLIEEAMTNFAKVPSKN